MHYCVCVTCTLQHEQILVVEDSLLNQRLLEAMLRRLGHTAVLAVDGQIAIDMATATDAGIYTYLHACSAVQCSVCSSTLHVIA
jgi:CheY-like chemotaxis protein